MFLLQRLLSNHTFISGSGVVIGTKLLVAEFLLGKFFATVELAFSTLKLVVRRYFFKVRQYFIQIWGGLCRARLAMLFAFSPVEVENNPLDLYSFNDFFFIIFSLQIFLLGLIGLCLSRKNLFLFLIVMEIVYLGISLLFLSFSVYWFYDVHGLLYAFVVMVVAAAEAAVGLSLLINAKESGVEIELFSSKKKDKLNLAGFTFLAVLSGLNPYFDWFCFFLLIFFLFTFIILALQFFFKNTYFKNLQKTSIYECGFESFGDSRSKFQSTFYVIALLYLIFDIELVFLFPWALAASVVGLWGHLVFLFFLVLLLLGFVYESLIGALEFDPTSAELFKDL